MMIIILSLFINIGYSMNFIVERNSVHRPGSTLHFVFKNGTQAEKDLVRSYAPQWTRYANLNFQFHEANAPQDIRRQAYIIEFACNTKQKLSYFRSFGMIETNDPSKKHNILFCFPKRDEIKNPIESATIILHEFGHILGFHHPFHHPSYYRIIIQNIERLQKTESDPRLKEGYGNLKGIVDNSELYTQTEGWYIPPDVTGETIMNYTDIYFLHPNLKLPQDGGYRLTLQDRIAAIKLYPGRATEAQARADIQREQQEDQQRGRLYNCDLHFAGYYSENEMIETFVNYKIFGNYAGDPVNSKQPVYLLMDRRKPGTAFMNIYVGSEFAIRASRLMEQNCR